VSLEGHVWSIVELRAIPSDHEGWNLVPRELITSATLPDAERLLIALKAKASYAVFAIQSVPNV
jgi:hypothetical protein